MAAIQFNIFLWLQGMKAPSQSMVVDLVLFEDLEDIDVADSTLNLCSPHVPGEQYMNITFLWVPLVGVGFRHLLVYGHIILLER